MIKTLMVSLFLKNTYQVNCIMYAIKQTPIIKHLQLFKEVMDFVNNLNAVVGEYIHLFNQQIGQLGG